MFRVIGGVGVVAGAAGSTLWRLVDVYKVQVLVAIAEACQSRGFSVFCQSVIVAVKTELVIFRVVFSIESRV